MDGDEGGAASLRGAHVVLKERVVFKASAHLGCDRDRGDGISAGLDRRLDAGWVCEGRRASTAAQGAFGWAAEVQVEERRSRQLGVARGLSEGGEVGAHELQADRRFEGLELEAGSQELHRERVVCDADELGERAPEVLGGVAREDELEEDGLGHAVHGREQPGSGEGQALNGLCGGVFVGGGRVHGRAPMLTASALAVDPLSSPR